MKIRTNFVSNSSSSSYILLTTVGDFKIALDTLTPFQQSVVKDMCAKSSWLEKQNIILISWGTGEMYDGYYSLGDKTLLREDEDIDDSQAEAPFKLRDALGKQGYMKSESF